MENPSSTIVNIRRKNPASVEAEEITSESTESFLLNLKNCSRRRKTMSELLPIIILSSW